MSYQDWFKNKFAWVKSGGMAADLAGIGVIGTHVKVALIGDSITARALAGCVPANSNLTASSPWNPANWVLGSPFVYSQGLAVSGDTVLGIFSRLNSIPVNIQCVFVMCGINDVLASTASATIIARIGAGISALVAARKVVVISTILPNNALSGAQVTILNAVNAYIATLSTTYSGRVFVADGFTALGGNVATGAATAGYLNSDNTHPTNAGAFAFANHASVKSALTSAYLSCVPDYDIYNGFKLEQSQYSEFRRSTGGSAGLISAGSGTIADGWRCLQNAGTATFTVDASTAYVANANFIGPWVKNVVSPDSYNQIFTITSAANNDNPRLRYLTQLSNTAANAIDGILAGDEFFCEVEVTVTNPVNLGEVSLAGESYFTQGTSPADQPYAGSNYSMARCGTSTDSSSARTALPAGFSAVLRTPINRIPQNINSTQALTALMAIDMIFVGTGSATVSFSRPRFWRKLTERIG